MAKMLNTIPLSLFFQGKTEELLALHEKGVNLNTLNDIGEVDWFDLLFHHHYVCFLTLVEFQALDLNIQEKDGQQVLDVLTRSLQTEKRTLTPEFPGVRALNVLLQHGADLNKLNSQGLTVLEQCVHLERIHLQNTIPVLNLLIEKGARVTPWMVAQLSSETLAQLEYHQLDSCLNTALDFTGLKPKRL